MLIAAGVKDEVGGTGLLGAKEAGDLQQFTLFVEEQVGLYPADEELRRYWKNFSSVQALA